MYKYINIEDHYAFNSFSQCFESLIGERLCEDFDSIVFVCIGSDRSTGDSLGPLIGYKLSTLNHNNVYVYGTLDDPVHAKNLADKILVISSRHPNALVVAIDACLGSMEHVGYVSIKNEPLRPGAGVNKDLPEIGDISIIGIVNFGGFMDFIILQNTRLHLVMKMADLISLGIKHTISRLGKKNSRFDAKLPAYGERQFILE